jgi:general secretion pathway protein A
VYTSYFGFKENPFSLTPDPNYLYLSRHHQEAFDHLLYGINERKGFIVIAGGVGTGKTTLCRALLGALNSSTKTAMIFNAYISDMELLKTINQEFGIEGGVSDQSKKGYIDGLNQFLLQTFSHDGNAVLLIDEAQNLSHSVLEEIRMLSNLETEKEKLVQIVLVGQLELKEILASPALKQLNERIVVRYDLKPLDRKDVQGYVEHRLSVAGGKGNVRFTKGALEAIFASSEGNPRRINGICDRALLIAYSKDEFSVSKKTIQKAIEDIRGDVTPGRPTGPRWAWAPKRVASLSVLLLLLLITVAGFGGWNFRKEISALISNEPAPNSSQAMPLDVSRGDEVQGQPVVPKKGVEAVDMAKVQTMPVTPAQQVETGKAEEPAAIPVLPKQEVRAIKSEKLAAIPAEPEIELASLFLSEKASLAGLFSLFDAKAHQASLSEREVHWGLFFFYAQPEHHVMFRKPFRVEVAGPADDPVMTPPDMAPPSSQYLLVREITANNAVVIDADSKEQLVTRDFILTHWADEVCWLYPYEDNDVSLVRGMRGQNIVRLQYALNQIGYPVEPTGLFGEKTFDQVVNFQTDFGLRSDGAVGTRTKGLLYQMTDELYP